MNFSAPLAAALVLSAVQPAAAATLIDYQPDIRISGDTTFSSPTGFAAIGFNLASASVLTGASFFAHGLDGQPVATPASVVWQFLSIAGNRPGAVLAQGVVDRPGRSEIASPPGLTRLPVTRFSFDVPSVSLGAGSYFLALHVESRKSMSLVGASAPASFGSNPARFVRTVNRDGTSTWTSRTGAQVISLSGDAVSAVPEPESWAMMLVGFGLLGAAIRYRRGRTTIALH